MTNHTVPLAAAAVLLGSDERLTRCAVRVAERVEISLDRVAAEMCPDTAARLDSYWERSKALWAQGRGPAVLVRRSLVTARQIDRKDGRVDLHDELAALEVLPGADSVIETLLGQDPDLALLQDAHADRTGNETTVTLTHRSLEWPTALGGPAGPGELHRVIVVTANHAKWRDRKVRRLARVDVSVDEVWPDPSKL